MPDFSFRLATQEDLTLIKTWWNKPHVKVFWDNSPEMWQNAENFLHGTKDLFDYWIGSIDEAPCSLLMTTDAAEGTKPTDLNFKYLQSNSLTMSIDFMIGEEKYLGKGLAAEILKAFIKKLKEQGASAILIDPETKNIKAVKAYQRAGFNIVDTFVRKNCEHYMMKINL